jgi:hypothetical protein
MSLRIQIQIEGQQIVDRMHDQDRDRDVVSGALRIN